MVEDILRYELDNSKLVLELKDIRHSCIIDNILEYTSHRDIETDCLQNISTNSELTKLSIQDIIISNTKRAQESARVLEEIFKLYSREYSKKFKEIRYKLYKVEKEIFE